MMARLRLTTKQVGFGYYKGNRTGSMGHFLKPKSTYQIDWRKVRTYVVPEDLDKFKVSKPAKLRPMKTRPDSPAKAHAVCHGSHATVEEHLHETSQCEWEDCNERMRP